MRIAAQPIRLINKQIDALAALQHTLDILRHNVTHAVDLATGRGKRVRRRSGIVRLEQRTQVGVESGAAVGGEGGEVRAVGGVGG